MPGLTGLITDRPREWAVECLLKMLEVTKHEPSYVFGTWEAEEMGLYVGWTARPGAFCDELPVPGPREDVFLFFSGEDYRDAESKRRFLSGLPSTHDGMYLLGMYDEDPEQFPLPLNGRFHGVLCDRRRNTVRIFNDRYGMHRLYIHEREGTLYFAAEAKSILAAEPSLRVLDGNSLGEFIAFSCTLEDKSLFRGVSVVPGGTSITRDADGALRYAKYFEPDDWVDQEPLTANRYYDEMNDLFPRVVRRYFDGPQPIALSLTGGIDTRLILAWHKPPPGDLPCYTFGGSYRDSQDVIVARQVAATCRQPHQVIHVGEEFLRGFEAYAARTIYMTDGCVDVSRSPVLYANTFAKEIAPVRMTGNYGGEVLRDVTMLRRRPVRNGPYTREAMESVSAAMRRLDGVPRRRPPFFAAFRQAPWHHYGLLALEQTQLTMRSPYLDNDLVRTVFRAPQSVIYDKGFSARLVAEGSPELLRIRTDRGHIGAPNDILARIKHALLELTFKAEYAYDYGMPQWLAAIDRRLSPFRPERLFLGRHKYYHFRIWYRRQLANYLQEVLLDPQALSRPHVDRVAVERVVNEHIAGVKNYTTLLHTLLSVELIYRTLIDPK